MFIAECPSLPGCVSHVRTCKEALQNIQDAIAVYIESLRKHSGPFFSKYKESRN